MRSTIYDNVPGQLKELAGKILKNNNLLKKSKDEGGKLGKYIHQVIDTRDEANVIANELFKSFVQLKEDHKSGFLNQLKYKERLSAYKEFFEISDITKAEIPVSLGSKDILMEIKKYF